jgi:hypothetical protein
LLRRYWIEFEVSPLSSIDLLAVVSESLYAWWIRRCGVTAFSQEDALNLIRQQLWLFEMPLPPIRNIIEDVDVSTLDPWRVLPQMGPPIWRGIWYPNFVV